MEYEELLNSAFENVKKVEECGNRCEIPKVQGMFEGNKTIISNFMNITNCFRRQPESFAKFLFKELASSGEISGERLVLLGKISSQIVNDKVKLYAEKFVICPKCKKPDTEIIEDSGAKYLKCLACGNKKQI